MLRSALVGGALVLLVVGCRHEPQRKPLTSAEYAERSAAICRRLEREVAAGDEATPDGTHRAFAARQRAFARLAALEPPGELEARARALRDALADFEQSGRDAAAAARELQKPARAGDEADVDAAAARFTTAQDRLARDHARVERAAEALGMPTVGGCGGPRRGDAGQPIAFVRRSDLDAVGVYVMDADGGRERRIVSPGTAGADFTGVAWSRDGRRLAFVSLSWLDYETLWITNADGSDARAVWSADHLADPTWAPDGRRLAFMGPDGLTILDLETRRANVLVETDPPQTVDVDWSPDGRWIATGEFAGIALVEPDEQPLPVDALDARSLTGIGERDDFDAAWSPDGRWIAFSRFFYFGSGGPELYVVRRDGTGLRRLTSGASDRGPAWSPDGTRVAFTRYPRVRGDDELDQDGGEIYVVHVATGATRRLTNNDVEDFAPHWRAVPSR